MSSLIKELIELTRRAGRLISLPSVEQVILPPLVPPTVSKYSKFGLLILEDGSAGLFYRLLDQDAWQALYPTEKTHSLLADIKASDPLLLCAGLAKADPLYRGLGMAAINAISQHVFRKAGFVPPTPESGSSSVSPAASAQEKRVGMIGYFTPMVAALQSANIDTTVIELDASLHQKTANLLVTDDLSQLSNCNPVYCTASTLLNDTLESILRQLPQSIQFELIGPSCGCFADPFFKRGVNKIGSSVVVDAEKAAEKIRAMQPWGDSVRKYEISEQGYPGLDALLDKLRN